MRPFLLILLTLSFSGFQAMATTSGEQSKWRAELNQSLDTLEKRINEMESTTQSLKGEAKKEWQATIDDLKKNRDKLKNDLSSTQNSVSETAKDYWGRLKSAVNELEKGVSEASRRLKEKVN